MIRALVIFGISGLLLTACASEEHMAMIYGEGFVAVNEDGEEVICRYESATGSRLAEQVCRTRAELEAEERETEHMLDRRNHGQDFVPLPRPPSGFGGQ
ncbi:hypothetical protein [Oceanicaulis sp.]|uniref:hypothetical protein n=2 Tax=Oceanicaulis sp. TaxID=1924941 RepID=UPI003BA89EBF